MGNFLLNTGEKTEAEVKYSLGPFAHHEVFERYGELSDRFIDFVQDYKMKNEEVQHGILSALIAKVFDGCCKELENGWPIVVHQHHLGSRRYAELLFVKYRLSLRTFFSRQNYHKLLGDYLAIEIDYNEMLWSELNNPKNKFYVNN